MPPKTQGPSALFSSNHWLEESRQVGNCTAETRRRMMPLTRPQHAMPAFVRDALAERGLAEAYAVRPSYQRNDYIGWIAGAKHEATRRQRLD